MARKSKIDHPLRGLRDIIGFSQINFASLVGVTPSTLKQIENGTLKLSQELSGRIFLATGCMLIQTSSDYEVFAWTGDVYRKQLYDQWKAEFRIDSAVALALAAQLANWTEIVMLASARPAAGKTFQVFHSLMQSLHQVAHQFDLQKHIDAHLIDRHATRTELHPVGELRANPLLAGMLKFADDANLNDQDQIPLTAPVGWLQHRELFNLVWKNRELHRLLVGIADGSVGTVPDDLAAQLGQLEAALESLV